MPSSEVKEPLHIQRAVQVLKSTAQLYCLRKAKVKNENYTHFILLSAQISMFSVITEVVLRSLML